MVDTEVLAPYNKGMKDEDGQFETNVYVSLSTPIDENFNELETIFEEGEENVHYTSSLETSPLKKKHLRRTSSYL